MAFSWTVDGDSVTAGYAGSNAPLTPWAGHVTDYYATAFGGSLVAPTNRAVPAYALASMLGGGPGFTGSGSGTTYAATGSLASYLAANSPDVVALMTGINDAAGLKAGTLTVAAFKAQLRQYINTVLGKSAQAGRQAIMILLSDNFVVPNNGAIVPPASQDAINRAMGEVASEYANNPYFCYVDVYKLNRQGGTSSSYQGAFLQSDGVHPNATFAKIMGAPIVAHMGMFAVLPGFPATADILNPSPLTLTPVTLKTSQLQAALGEYDGPDLTTSNILIQAVSG